MGLPSVLQRLNDLEAYRISELIREAEIMTNVIKSLDRIFNIELSRLTTGSAFITTNYDYLSPAGYITAENALVAPVTVVYEGNTVPFGAAVVLRMENVSA